MAIQDRIRSNNIICLDRNPRHILLMRELKMDSKLTVLCKMLVNRKPSWCLSIVVLVREGLSKRCSLVRLLVRYGYNDMGIRM